MRYDTSRCDSEASPRTDPVTLQRLICGMGEVGFLDTDIDASSLVDGSYLPEGANTVPDLEGV